jgi:putative NIF3 family GTP cyclohydrolase 1 type 2
LAPQALAEPWDNCGLLVGDRRERVKRMLVALDLTEPVLAEAVAGAYDTVLTHHPLLFSPLTSLVESRPRERMVRELIQRRVNLLAHHTNLDSAEHGLAAVAADALGLEKVTPLRRSPAAWFKFVGFVPADAVEKVASAVFEAGAGGIGDYQGCAFAAEEGRFTPGPEAHPRSGNWAFPSAEVRWETVVQEPLWRLSPHTCLPIPEAGLHICPVEDVRPDGIGRKGHFRAERPWAGCAPCGSVGSKLRLEWERRPSRAQCGRCSPGRPGLLQEAAGWTSSSPRSQLPMPNAVGGLRINLPPNARWWYLRRWAETLPV